MAKKDTTSDWKDWILGKKKGQADGGQAPVEGSAEPPVGLQPGPSQTSPPEPVRPEEVREQVDDVLGMKPEPTQPPPVTPPPQMRPGAQTEPPPAPEPYTPVEPPRPEPPPPPPRPPEQPEPRPAGSGRLPKDIFAHLVLLDINGDMRKARELPRFFPLKRTRTLAGRHVRAHIHLDDEATVRPEHARILYEDKDGQGLFIIDPVEGCKVLVNGRQVYSGGAVLDSGDLITIGSATLIFYQKNLKD